MEWRSSSSDGSVSIAYLLERQVSLQWQEAVAIVLEIAEVLERSGKRAVPRYANLVITPTGTIEFLRGRTQSGQPIPALAATLSELLSSDCPTQLRLVLATAGPETSSYKTLGEFSEALKCYERPGRRSLIAQVHERALETPQLEKPVKNVPEKKPRPAKRRHSLRKVLVPLTAVLVVAAAAAAGVFYVEQRDPGAISGRAAAFQGRASDVWDVAVEFGGQFSESARKDLSTLVDRARQFGTPALAEEETAADEEAMSERSVSRTSGRVAVTRAPVGPAGASPVSPAVIAPPALVPDIDTALVAEAPAPLLPAKVFDTSDVNVTPPVTLRRRLPSAPPAAEWDEDVGVVEAVVSWTGEVEKVKLISPPNSVHEAMILSAIKTWRFSPAKKDGRPVRYRYLIPVAIPR